MAATAYNAESSLALSAVLLNKDEFSMAMPTCLHIAISRSISSAVSRFGFIAIQDSAPQDFNLEWIGNAAKNFAPAFFAPPV